MAMMVVVVVVVRCAEVQEEVALVVDPEADRAAEAAVDLARSYPASSVTFGEANGELELDSTADW